MGYCGRTAAVLTPLLLAGCLNFNADYPEKSWPRRLSNGGCIGIVGNYANRGEMVPNDYKDYTPELAPFFLRAMNVPNYQDKYGKADHVLLSLEQGVLTARVMAGDAVLATAEFSEKEKTLVCRPEGAVIRDETGWARGKGNPLAGVEYSSYTLIATANQSLVVKSKGGGTGLVFMLVPVSASETRWYQFHRWQLPIAEPQDAGK